MIFHIFLPYLGANFNAFPNYMSIVSQNIKYLRRLNGLTQEQFSRKIGIKRSLVGAYEEARATPPLDKLKVIANCFNISVDALVKQDIRKLRQTPDMSFGFEKETDTKRSESTRSFEDVATEFLNKIQPISQIPTPKPSVFATEKPANEPVPVQPNSAYAAQTRSFEKQSTFSPPPKEDIRFETQQSSKTSKIPYVSLSQQYSYIKNIGNDTFGHQLPTFQMPYLLDSQLRAFEFADEFPIKNSIVFGEFVRNWELIKESAPYILVTKSYGIIYRRVFNQLAIKGTFFLSSDSISIPSKEISGADICEIWEVKGYFSMSIPQPPVSFDKIEKTIDELKFEVERLKRK